MSDTEVWLDRPISFEEIESEEFLSRFRGYRFLIVHSQNNTILSAGQDRSRMQELLLKRGYSLSSCHFAPGVQGDGAEFAELPTELVDTETSHAKKETLTP